MTAAPIRVRRLAALDLTGTGRRVRRRARLVRLEFIASATLGLALGAWFMASGAPSWLGIWTFGIGVNYVALSVVALDLLRHPHHLHAELDGVDLQRELRRYSAVQLVLVVPFLVAAAAIAQRAGRPHAVRGVSDGTGTTTTPTIDD